MSDMKIALVAEGPTDKIVIEAALSCILPHPFVLTLLQPDSANSINGGFSKTGTGWVGVYRWCRQMATMSEKNLLENNPLLFNYDLIIIHLDGDVAETSYAAGNIKDNPRDDLPCISWPPSSSANISCALSKVLLGWLEQNNSGDKTILCFPSYCTETWVAATLYGQQFVAIGGVDIELFKNVYDFLLSKPKSEKILLKKNGRVKKRVALFRSRQDELIKNWHQCVELCSQARLFKKNLTNVLKASGLNWK